MLTNIQLRTTIFVHLPLIAMVMFISHTHFLMANGTTANQYFTIGAQIVIECLPFFIAHHLAYKTSRYMQKLSWVVGFILYPLIGIALESAFHHDWLLNGQDILLCAATSLVWFINHAISEKSKDKKDTSENKKPLLKKVLDWFTLDTSIMLLLLIWALIMAVFLTTEPLTTQQNNSPQSFKVELDLTHIANQLPIFISYLWQCVFIALLIFAVYLINRYQLIKQVLAKHGVLAFVSSALMFIVIATPILSSLILYLPANQSSTLYLGKTLYLSDNLWAFAPQNYQLVFLIIAISTPLILLFEKQQQETIIAYTKQQQTITELQLLQQQINPHFLFNTLNNLYAMTLIKSDDAPHLIVKLSNLLRYTIYEGQKPNVTLTQEIAYLKDYIALEQIRSHNKCTITQQWPDDETNQSTGNYAMPPLLMIMLLENAFKHGVASSMNDSFIRFTMALDGNKLSVTCENSLGPSLEKTPANSDAGIGLENLRRRLNLLYPKTHTFSCGPQNDLWLATLTLELSPC